MGLHNTAHYLKSKGRGTDTELVHMSKREIKGLQQLAMAHGGSLTVNPDTGLVEAGFLEQALPIIAAAAATYFTGGAAAAALTPMMGATMGGIAGGALAGAGISGLTAAVTGKDVGNAALMGGVGGAISGGLGAYGPTDVAGSTGAVATQEAATNAGTQAIGGATATPASTGIDPGLLEGMSKEQVLAQAGPQTVSPQQLSQGVSQGMYTPQQATQYGQAYTNAYANAPQPTYYSQLKPDQYIQKAGILALPAAGLVGDQQQQQLGPEDETSPVPRISSNFQAYVPPQPSPYYKARYPKYADGGIVAFQNGGPVERMTAQNTAINPQGGLYPQGMINKTQYATPSQRPTSLEVVESEPNYGARVNPITGTLMAKGGLPADAMKDMPSFNPKVVSDSDANTRGLSALDATNYRNKKLMAKAGIKMAEMPKTGIKSLGGDFSDVGAGGGVAHLGDYSDGGRLLKGPGDGMSDNIPATIGRKQPARLANGEFVVPADVVSHLGNGSTDAGAKKLYAMMDKIRRARTGKKKQAPAVNPNKYLPA